jgi:hypothetical protein
MHLCKWQGPTELLVSYHVTTLGHNSQHHDINLYCSENLKSPISPRHFVIVEEVSKLLYL